MNNKRTIERITTIALSAFLVGMFFYQVAYGMTTEGSYQQGYKWGRDGYQCSNFNADRDNGLNSCNVGTAIYQNVPNNYARIVDSISNRTACLDGMVKGWKHWCNTDLELCAKFVLSNVFPGVFADNETGVNICLKDAGDNVNNDDPNNTLSPINGHCGGGVGEATAPYWKAIQDNSTSWPVISMTTGKVLNGAKVPPVDIHGTWNFVNETKSAMGHMSVGNMTSSGKITFYLVTPNHIEGHDGHGDTIRLMR
jgi:hypothetical protein